MVRFIDDDQVEEVRGKLIEPLVGIGGELVDVRQDDMRLLAAADVSCFQRANIRTRDHVAVREDLHPAPETFLPVRDVEGFLQFVLYRQIWSNDQDAALGNAEGQDRGETRLPASHRQLDYRRLFS